MPNSPSTYMKRKQRWAHVPGKADRYQEGVHHAHGQDITTTREGQHLQETWPDVSPDQKALEGDDIPV